MAEQGIEYLLIILPPLGLWSAIYWLKPRFRHQMFWVSIIVGSLSVLTGILVWTTDWWQPPTITGTLVGIEDFLLGFTFAGISAIAYELLYGTRLQFIEARHDEHWQHMTLIVLVGIGVFGLIHWWSGRPSWQAWLAASGIALALSLIYRPDLTTNALVTGAAMVVLSFLWFAGLSVIDPVFTEGWYFLDELTGITIVGGPIEDYLWAFTAGALGAIMYEFATQRRATDSSQ